MASIESLYRDAKNEDIKKAITPIVMHVVVASSIIFLYGDMFLRQINAISTVNKVIPVRITIENNYIKSKYYHIEECDYGCQKYLS